MKRKSSEKAKPKTKMIRFNANASKSDRVFLAGDFNSCVLVVPEVFGMQEHITLYRGRFHEYPL